mmetsp:Transcript_28273/g.85239  ORF Transcript_28273/g.85239 Transcript_28273/m.85239 type:complete len:209 (+) Transcript_28273:382-1008(+)
MRYPGPPGSSPQARSDLRGLSVEYVGRSDGFILYSHSSSASRLNIRTSGRLRSTLISLTDVLETVSTRYQAPLTEGSRIWTVAPAWSLRSSLNVNSPSLHARPGALRRKAPRIGVQGPLRYFSVGTWSAGVMTCRNDPWGSSCLMGAGSGKRSNIRVDSNTKKARSLSIVPDMSAYCKMSIVRRMRPSQAYCLTVAVRMPWTSSWVTT